MLLIRSDVYRYDMVVVECALLARSKSKIKLFPLVVLYLDVLVSFFHD